MSAAVDLVKALALDGVEFSTDGQRLRWRNSNGKMTPTIVAVLAADKGQVIDFLTGKPRLVPRQRDLRRDLKLDPVARPDDADRYADVLRHIGPCGYGPIAVFLGWGATRAANAEEVLRKAGRIIYDHTGRGTLQ